MNDLYAKGWITKGEAQETDIHWRCKKGKGSFNWRMKFPVMLPMKFPYLHLQLWDKDIIKWNDCIAEVEMDLTPHVQRALRAKAPINVFAPEVRRCVWSLSLPRAVCDPPYFVLLRCAHCPHQMDRKVQRDEPEPEDGVAEVKGDQPVAVAVDDAKPTAPSQLAPHAGAGVGAGAASKSAGSAKPKGTSALRAVRERSGVCAVINTAVWLRQAR